MRKFLSFVLLLLLLFPVAGCRSNAEITTVPESFAAQEMPCRLDGEQWKIADSTYRQGRVLCLIRQGERYALADCDESGSWRMTSEIGSADGEPCTLARDEQGCIWLACYNERESRVTVIQTETKEAVCSLEDALRPLWMAVNEQCVLLGLASDERPDPLVQEATLLSDGASRTIDFGGDEIVCAEPWNDGSFLVCTRADSGCSVSVLEPETGATQKLCNGRLLSAEDGALLVAKAMEVNAYDVQSETYRPLASMTELGFETDDGVCAAYRTEECIFLVAESGTLSIAAASEDTRPVVTLATISTLGDTYNLAAAYNAAQRDYRLCVTQYDSAESLNLAIASGDAPDMVHLMGLNVHSFIEKGVLTDLSGTIGSEKLLDGILSLYKTGGNLYSIPIGFTVSTLVADQTMIEGKADLQWLLSLPPESIAWFDPLRDMIQADAGLFVREDAATRLAEILSFSASIESSRGSYSNERSVSIAYINTMAEIESACALVPNGTVIGIPGASGAVVDSPLEFGILSLAENTEGAADVLRFFLSEKAQKTVAERYIPIAPEVFSDLFDELSTQQQDGLSRLLGLCGCRNDCDEALMEICCEEAAAYYSGDASLDKTVAAIQSRASIYLAEQG